jgi:hypothetical protein
MRDMAFLGSYIFAANGRSIYRSTNDGYNWVLSNNGIRGYMNTIAVSGSDIIAAGTGGFYGDSSIYLSTNYGNNWVPIGQVLPEWLLNIFSIKVYNSNVIIASDSGIFLTTNRGTNWIHKDQGFYKEYCNIRCLETDNNYIYAGVRYASVWRRQLSEIIGVQNISTQVPDKFFLYQNYPNPFNPNTTIKFQITRSGPVVLKVYDILGKEIETLLNEQKAGGIYSVSWDASKYSSGIYFYRITVPDYTETKIMLFIK